MGSFVFLFFKMQTFVQLLEQLPLELIWHIQALSFTPPTPTPYQRQAMGELYTVQLFWTYFHIFEARQRMARHQGMFHSTH